MHPLSFPTVRGYLVPAVCIMYCAISTGANLRADGSTGEKTTVGMYLGQIANQADCYFTLEYIPINSNNRSFDSKIICVKDITSISTPDQAIVLLRKKLKGFRVVANSLSPTIIHIIDERLAPKNFDQKNVLDNKISFKYNGVMQNIPDVMRKRLHVTIQKMDQPCFVPYIVVDEWTKASLTAKETSVREVLTGGLPLSQLGVLLWFAEIRIDQNRTDTFIRYDGRRYEGERFEFSFQDKPVSFSNGEKAFAINCYLFKKNPHFDCPALAIRYIEEEVKKERPMQVRWAMLFLSKFKCKEGIAPLIKHIDYRYTPYPVLEESYPAIRALMGIGAPASAAAAVALSSEQSALRMRLLCYTILRIDGVEKARKLIEGVLLGVQDETRKQRIRAALTQAQTLYENGPIISGEDKLSR